MSRFGQRWPIMRRLWGRDCSYNLACLITALVFSQLDAISRKSTSWFPKPSKNRTTTATQPPQSSAALMNASLSRPRPCPSRWRAWRPEVSNRSRYPRPWKSALWTLPEVTSTSHTVLMNTLNATAVFVASKHPKRIYLDMIRTVQWNWYRFNHTVNNEMIIRNSSKLSSYAFLFCLNEGFFLFGNMFY